jgi:hypothetical protein
MGQQRQLEARCQFTPDVLRAAEGIYLASSVRWAESSPSTQENLLEIVSYGQEG